LRLNLKLLEDLFPADYSGRPAPKGYFWKVVVDPTRNAEEPGWFYGSLFRLLDILPTVDEVSPWPDGIVFEHIETGQHLTFLDGQPKYLDTSPSVGGLQERAIWASDLVILPSATEFASLDSVGKTVQTLHALKIEKGWTGGLLGILPTFFDDKTRESRNSLNDLQHSFGDKVLPPIHSATVLRECWSKWVKPSLSMRHNLVPLKNTRHLLLLCASVKGRNHATKRCFFYASGSFLARA
jgi:hypothetical protein